MNIDQAQITLFLSKVRGFLLLKNPADAAHNLLSILGLYTIDFPDRESVEVSYDENGINILTKPFGAKCTCANEKEELKLRLEHTGHGIRHTTSCDLARREKVSYHELVREIDATDPVVSVYDFDWPRDIEPYRNSIVTRFPEQANDGLWKAFSKTWADIVDLLPALPEAEDDSLFAGAELDAVTEREDCPLADVSICFGDTVQGIEDGMADTFEQKIANSDDDCDYDSDIPIPVAATKLVASLEQPPKQVSVTEALGVPGCENVLFHGDLLPAQAQPEPSAPKRRGRKPGSTNAAKAIREAEASEMKPEDFVATPATKGEPQVLPACSFYAKMMREEFARLSATMEDIEVASVIPVEDLKMVKESLDRMALRSAHMELRGVNEDGERRVNMLIETTVSNVLETMQAATRDLGLAPDDPRTWEAFRKLLSDVSDKAKAMLELMTQPGAGPAIYSVGTQSGSPNE
jgi:hypothetical protein